MNRHVKRTVILMFSLVMILSSLTIFANADSLKGRYVNAYLSFSDEKQTYTIDSLLFSEDDVVITNALITGDGEYSVSIDFSETAAGYVEGISYGAIVLDNGNGMLPGAVLNIKQIVINGDIVSSGKGYSYSDDGKRLLSYFYNDSVINIPATAMCVDGDLSDTSAVLVSSEDFNRVESIEVIFEVINTDTYAYISLKDADEVYEGKDLDDSKGTKAYITGDGTYSVSYEFESAISTFSYVGIVIDNLENLAPNATITINDIKVNGKEIPFGKYYAYSDEKAIKLDLYNDNAGSELFENPRRFDNDLDKVTSKPVQKEYLSDVDSIEVTFTVAGTEPIAYIMFADEDWSVQYWDNDFEGVVPTNAFVNGEGQYYVSLNFEETPNTFANGCAFAALGIRDGENLLQGWNYTIDEVLINGESVDVGKYYAYSEDGINTRINLYNEWISEIPSTARRADSDLKDVSSTPISKEYFSEIKSIEVLFTAIWGPKPEIESELSYDEKNDEQQSQEEATSAWEDLQDDVSRGEIDNSTEDEYVTVTLINPASSMPVWVWFASGAIVVCAITVIFIIRTKDK